MSKLLNSKMFKDLVLCFSTIFCAEIIFMLLSKLPILDYSLIRVFLSSLIISLFISLVCSFISKKVRYTITFVILFLISFYIFFQICFVNYMGVYASVNASSQLAAVTDYIVDFFKSTNLLYLTIFIPFIVNLVYVIFFDKRDELEIRMIEKNKYLKDSFLKLGIFVGLFFVLSFLYHETLVISFMNNNKSINLADLYSYPSMASTSIKNFGVLTFGYTDIKAKLLNIEEQFVIVNVEKPSNSLNTERTFDDSVWESLITNETNNDYLTIHNYLINNDSSSKNEMTGLFEGKNVIMVMMESVNDIIVNPEYYPNFSKMMDNGYYFENTYSPRNSCPTGNNEFSGMTSLYSIYNMCSANVYKDNIYPQSIFNLFEEQGYTTSSMHNFTESYYYRSDIHAGMGSDIYYGVQDLGIDYGRYYGEWSSDKDFGEVAMDITLNSDNEEPFMLWMTTVSAHQPFSTSSIEGDLYLDLFEDTGYSKEMQRYMSKVKVTDDMFGVLMDRLEEEGILEDTVIVVYDDHYAYGLDENELAEVLDRSFDGYEADRTPFLIYNPSIEAEVISGYTSFMDILPTVANLFDLNYDPRLYFGTDIFSPEYESRVVFPDGSWKNEYAYYDVLTGRIEYYGNLVYTEEELNYINTEISNEMKLSSMIIKNDYYNYLFSALEKEEQKIKNEELANN